MTCSRIFWQVISSLSENATYSKADQKGDSGKGNHKYDGECWQYSVYETKDFEI